MVQVRRSLWGVDLHSGGWSSVERQVQGTWGGGRAPWAVDLWQPGTPSSFPSVREKK